MTIIKKIKTLSFAECALFVSLFFVGIFHVYLSCALSIALLIRLWMRNRKTKRLTVPLNMTMLAILVLVLGYAVASLWAIDSGAAIFGFFKFLPLALYSLELTQEPDGREATIRHLPYLVTVMTVLSIGCMYIPSLESFFAVSGRLSGFIQYPNTFAVILLVAELLLLTKDHPRLWDYLCISVLLFGILYTGSRTVFVLAGLTNVIALLITKNKKVRFIAFGCIALGIVLVLAYCLVTDNFAVLTRYLNISTAQSTFVGRLLYAQDALPVILRNPFGLGYMGYYFIQQSIQTGVYAVMFIHNDFLQILLDVGWIPFLVFAAAIVMTLIDRGIPTRYKLIVVTVLLHACLDFDLQYVAVFMMLLLFMQPKTLKTVTLKKSRSVTPAISIVLICLCLYAGTVQTLTRFELYDVARVIYNHDTVGDIEQLKEITDTAEAEEVADRILKRNSHVSVAYSVKARAAYAKGDFANVIKYKTLAIQKAPFSHVEYWEYGRMLVNGIKLYEKAGDQNSADICKRELLALSELLPAQKNRLSERGAAIVTQPKLFFPSDLKQEIDALKEGG